MEGENAQLERKTPEEDSAEVGSVVPEDGTGDMCISKKRRSPYSALP
jgi:hypothetical protein